MGFGYKSLNIVNCGPCTRSWFESSNFGSIGLSKLLNEKNISSARRSQLDLASVSSLTPSVLTSPNASRHISPTGTPLHTPEESLPGSPDETAGAGMVYSFFSSLKSAIYGQQRKEHRSSKMRRKREEKRHNLGIMEAVEEVGFQVQTSSQRLFRFISLSDQFRFRVHNVYAWF